MKHIIALICCLAFIKSSQAQDYSLYRKAVMVQGGDTLPYRILFPLHYDASKKYPVLFFLHGAGERGNDNEKQLIHGADLFLRQDVREKFPAFIIFPQCASNSYWSNVLRMQDTTKRPFYFLKDGPETKAMTLVQQLVQYVFTTYPINRSKVYVGGLSMGGMGTFEIVRRNPKLFTAAIAICGGADVATATSLKQTHWWIFHGLKDNVVDPGFSKQMFSAIKKTGAEAHLTLYPEANHNSWDSAFAEPKLLPWLFSKTK